MSKLNMTWRALGAALIALSLTAATALAQQPGRIRGQIEKADGDMLVLKTRDGAMLNVKLDEKVRVAALVKASIADIKTDSFIGIAGVPQAGRQHPGFLDSFIPAGAARRRARPVWTLGWTAERTMTNGYVESMVMAKDGDTMMVKYKDGEKKIDRYASDRDRRGSARQQRRTQGRRADHYFRLGQAAGWLGAREVMYVGRDVTPAM